MKLEAFIHATLFDKYGNFKKRFDPVRAQSYVRQMMDILLIQASGAAASVLDTGATPRAVGAYTANFDCAAAAADKVKGMVIGTDNTPVSITQNALIAKVVTNVSYGSVSFAGPTIDESTCYFDIIRTFTNATGATLGIKEVGLYCRASTTAWYFMLDRTLYNLDVPNGEAVTLAYRISVTV